MKFLMSEWALLGFAVAGVLLVVLAIRAIWAGARPNPDEVSRL